LPEESWQLGQFFIDIQRRGQLPHPAYAKIKTAKIPSKVNTAFLQNFAPAKISRYTVVSD